MLLLSSQRSSEYQTRSPSLSGSFISRCEVKFLFLQVPNTLDLFLHTPMPTISFFSFRTHLSQTFQALVKFHGLPYQSLLTPNPLSVDLLCLTSSILTQIQVLSQNCKRLFFLTSSFFPFSFCFSSPFSFPFSFFHFIIKIFILES